MQSLSQAARSSPQRADTVAKPNPTTADTTDRSLESEPRAQGTTPVLKETETESFVPMESEQSVAPVKPGSPDGELHGHTGAPAEGEAGAPAEGEAGAPAEGEAGAPAEGEAGAPTEGEAGAPAEGEAGAPAEGEAGAPAEGEAGAQPPEGETMTRARSSGAVVQAEEDAAVRPARDPSPNNRGADLTSGRPGEGLIVDAGATTEQDPESARHVKETRSAGKLVPDRRRYVSHKSMTDPLKMDMSTPGDMHLTSSQLSLQCIECHIIFSDHKSKERHLKLNHPAEYEHCILRNSFFACYVCDRQFTNSTELMAHQKAHIEKKPFKCPICGQAFKKSSELTAHKKIHYGEDGYACTDCGKPCKTLTLLKYHRRTHTGERPYVCKECGKRFSMSKALQKHLMEHETADSEDVTSSTKPQLKKKNNSAPTVKYPCSVCKALFKTTKTRLHHMKNKHNLLPAETSDTLSVGQQVRHGTPTITPISICQSTLLQGDPIGPLQQVDANIDTEQIRKLIESLGNVQKVNQVVILGQVPPNALPLDLQQIPKLGEPFNLNVNPSPMGLLEVRQAERSMTVELEYANSVCDPMEQTIILEPITPDGQLLNPSFSDLGSYVTPADNTGSALNPEQSETHRGEMMLQVPPRSETGTIQSVPVNQSVCEGEVGNLQNPDQTVILELTTALTPTEELEQTEPAPQTEIPSSQVPTTDSEKTSGDTVIDQQETGLMPTVQLETTPLQTAQQDLLTCPFVPTDTFTEALESQTNPEEVADSQMQTAVLESVHSVLESVSIEETHDKSEQPRELLADGRESQQNLDKLSTSEDSAPEQTPSQLETKQVQQASQSSVNVMSAQELVKIRKRKPAKIFIFEDPIEQLVAKIKKHDKHFDEKPAKRQRKNESCLVVKFGSKNKKQKKPTQPCQVNQKDLIANRTSATTLSEKKVPAKKTITKTKKDKKAHPVAPKIQTTPSHDLQVQKSKEYSRKNKLKRQKDVDIVAAEQMRKQEVVASPVVKKKKTQKILKKRQPKKSTDGKLTSKGRKKKLTKEQKGNAETSTISVTVPGPQITEDCLLLLKGHKQPQLKVYKLDPSKAPGQAQDISPQESPNHSQGKDASTESSDLLTPAIKKKGGRPKKTQKARSLLSSLMVSNPPPEPQPTKPKSTRKRKASWKVELEGVITSSSHSRRALECNDCGETFSGVCALQQHKATMHIVESPGLTFTNGNIFEGVSKLDLCQSLKPAKDIIGVMNTATEWDTETEMGEMALENREGRVSFPSLSLSPSSLVAGAESGGAAHEENHENTAVGVPKEPAEQTSLTVPGVLSPCPSKSDTKQMILSHSDSAPQAKDRMAGPVVSDGGPSIPQGTKDEDVKEDLLLEVDLVTVGEHNEIDDPNVAQEDASQNSLVGQSNPEGDSADTAVPAAQIEGEKTTERSTNSQTTSCFTQQCKEEEEEVLVQRKEEAVAAGGRRAAPGGRRRGARGRLKRNAERPRGREEESVESGECQVIFHKPPQSTDSAAVLEGELVAPERGSGGNPDKVTAAVACASPSLEQAPVESANNVAVEAPAPAPDEPRAGESSQSPDVILDQCQEGMRISQGQGSNSIAGSEEIPRKVSEIRRIKVEEAISEPPPLRKDNENQPGMHIQARTQGVRIVLIKQESSLIQSGSQATGGSTHIRWNVEEMDIENPPETGTTEGTRPSSTALDFNAQQCIFYPVKEEQRETLLGASRREENVQTLGVSSDGGLMESSAASDEEIPSTEDYQQIRVTESMLSADADAGEAREETEHRELRDFLLRSSDEEDTDVTEFWDPPPDSEAQAVAFLSENPSNPPQPNGGLHKEPIDYFSKYFGWDTWEELCQYTNKLSNLSEPVTAKEVAQYVGIHIAMGTLKFPSLKLYWQDLTKVPLIAETMPLPRFVQLAGKLRLASPEKEAIGARGEDVSERDTQGVAATAPPSDLNGHNNGDNGDNGIPPRGAAPGERSVQTDPLWRVRRLLRRFQAGCLLLRRQGNYGVDQYCFPLTAANNKHSLHCTTLMGLDGLILHLDLTSDLSDKEAAVEKLVPRGSTVFLCKQELSTPVMMERLLDAGTHSAGRVGGDGGQKGDEFVSSDGRLMLRRSHRGFILSTVGSGGRRDMASLIGGLERAQTSARRRRDLQSLYRIPLTASAPAAWPQAVLWRLADLALVNSWLHYRQDRGPRPEPLTLMAFRLEVAKALAFSSGSDAQDSRLPAQPRSEEAHASSGLGSPDTLQGGPLPDAFARYDGSGHWPEQPDHGEGGRCRFEGCERTSRVLCLKCCVFLCISRNHNCFLNFHNQGSS